MNNQELLLANTDLISDAVKEYVDQKVNECIPKSGYRNRLGGYQLASYIQPSSNQITISYSSTDMISAAFKSIKDFKNDIHLLI